MAVLDFSILSSLSVIFVFLAVFITGWGVSMMIDPFKLGDDRKKIYSLLAFALAFIIILSRPVLAIISFSIPWFTVLLMIGFFMLFFSKMLSPDLDVSELAGKPNVYGFLIFFTGIILLFGMAGVFGQSLLEKQPGVTAADQITGETQPTDQFVPVDEFVPQEKQGVSAVVAPQGDLGSNIVLTLFHPNVLGMLFMLILATITILLIGR